MSSKPSSAAAVADVLATMTISSDPIVNNIRYYFGMCKAMVHHDRQDTTISTHTKLLLALLHTCMNDVQYYDASIELREIILKCYIRIPSSPGTLQESDIREPNSEEQMNQALLNAANVSEFLGAYYNREPFSPGLWLLTNSLPSRGSSQRRSTHQKQPRSVGRTLMLLFDGILTRMIGRKRKDK